MVRIVNDTDRPEIKTGFYEGEIVDTKEVQLIDGYMILKFDVQFDIVPFPVNKMVKCKPEHDFFISNVFKSAKVPGRVAEDGSGTDYIESDLVGAKILALVYQDDYVNISDVCALDASEKTKDRLLKKHYEYLNKQAKKSQKKVKNGTEEVLPNVQEVDDLPF